MGNFHIQWHILDRCNLRCSHCYQDSYTEFSELKIDNLFKIADNLDYSMKKMRKRLNLLITGGEPLIKEELLNLLDYLNNKKSIKETNLITNALLLSKFIDKLSGFKKVKSILFSLDGTTQEINDRIRGEGVFNKVIYQINNIDSKRFRKILMYTVSKINYDDAFNLIEFGRFYNLDAIIIEKFIPLGQANSNYSNVLTKNMLKKLYDFLLTKLNYDNSFSYEYRALKIEFNTKNHKKDCIRVANCIIGSDGCAIMPNADVYPCRRLPLTIGNLLNKTLYDIYNESNLLKELKDRSLLKGKCKECTSKECFGCRAMVFAVKKDLFGEDPHCYR